MLSRRLPRPAASVGRGAKDLTKTAGRPSARRCSQTRPGPAVADRGAARQGGGDRGGQDEHAGVRGGIANVQRGVRRHAQSLRSRRHAVGAAVARRWPGLRHAALADGSDMGGSLRNPASYCNVVGLRPSPGVYPAWPAGGRGIPLSVDGPMGRTVQDVALLLSVLAGPDALVPAIALKSPGAVRRATRP